MDYMTPSQAAEKWGISRRSVRQYLDNDRIPGVQHINNRILIPLNAEKPSDKRLKSKKKEEQATEMLNPFVLTGAAFEPGQAKAYLDSLDNEDRRNIGMAELCYLQGKTEESDFYSAKLTSANSAVVRIGALLIRALNSFTGDEVHQFLTNYTILKTLAEAVTNLPTLRSTGYFFKLFLNIIIDDNSDIRFPEMGLDAFDQTAGLKAMGIYAYARWLILNDNAGRAIGLAEGALMFMKDLEPVATVYLALVIAQGYIVQGKREKAKYYFNYAWGVARKDGILIPFAEFRYFLAGLLEQCIKADYPAEYRLIMGLSSRHFNNWVYSHNLLTGDSMTDKLSPVEFYVASFAANGQNNEDIALHLGISVNSVRTHMRNIFNKLDIESRKELTKYVLIIHQ